MQLSAFAGHRFRDGQLCKRALTHRSTGSPDNERMEFLGDALLGAILAEELYRRFPNASEGSLTGMRSRLARRSLQAKRARAHGVERFVHVGNALRLPLPDSILSGILEALIAAIYLDAGMAACREAVDVLYGELLDGLNPEEVSKDPKSALQELLQDRGLTLPRYRVLQEIGPPHDRKYLIACYLEGQLDPCVACGPSKQAAEQDAARGMLGRLQENG